MNAIRIPKILTTPQGIVGITVLVILVGSVVGGIFIVPKTNPYAENGMYVAAPFAVPAWASSLYGNLPPNIPLPSTVSLIEDKSPQVLSFWNARNISIDGDKVVFLWNSTLGPSGTSFTETASTYGNSGPGSIELIISGPNPINVSLYHIFNYTYDLPGDYNFFIMQSSIYFQQYNSTINYDGYLTNPKNQTFWMFTVGSAAPVNPLASSAFQYFGPNGWHYVLGDSASPIYSPWYYTSNLTPNETSFASSILLHSAFSSDGAYKVQYQIQYNPQSSNASAKVFLSDVFFKFLGSKYGLLGTDNNGASVYQEYVQGGEFDLILATLVGLMIVFVGAGTGLLGGYFGGKIDQVLVSITDFIFLFPALALYIVLISVFGQLLNLTSQIDRTILIGAIIIVFSWPATGRIIRGQTYAVSNQQFVEAAKALGESNLTVIRKHILNHIFPIIVVQIIFDVPAVIGVESTLDFLGLGITGFPTWGNMLGYAEHYVTSAPHYIWWWILPPGLALLILGIALFYFGESLLRLYGIQGGRLQ
ncbi:peptide transporter [Sulfolobales archaeon HS-7]|nr:peptide transporter [Sulfolobales archaeon HS-7]